MLPARQNDAVEWTDDSKAALVAALHDCAEAASARPPLPADVVASVADVLFEGASTDLVSFGHETAGRMMYNCLFAEELNYCLHDTIIDAYLSMVRRCMVEGGEPHCDWRSDVLLPAVADISLLRSFDRHQRDNGLADWGVGRLAALGDWKHLCGVFAKKHVANKQDPFIFTAVTWEPGHWHEVTMDIATKTCTVNDSFALPLAQQGPGDKHHCVVELYARFLSIYHEYLKQCDPESPMAWEAPAPEDWTVTVDAEYPRQEQCGRLGRHNDCAVFASQSAKLRCRNVNPTQAVYLRQSNALQMRLSMYSELHSGDMLQGHLHVANPLAPDPPDDGHEDGLVGEEALADMMHIETLLQDCKASGADNGKAPAESGGPGAATAPAPQTLGTRVAVPVTFVKVPGCADKCVALDSLVTMFFDDKRGGDKIPADRLSRVKLMSRRMADVGTSAAVTAEDQVAVDGEFLTLFSNVGMCLHDGGVKQTWTGRVQKMWKPVGRSMKDTIDPVPLTGADCGVSGYEVVCTWYRKRMKDGRQVRHGAGKEPVYDYPVVDTKRYDMQSFLGLVDMVELLDAGGKVTGHVLKDHTATLQRWNRHSKTMWNDLSYSKEDKGSTKFRRQFGKAKGAGKGAGKAKGGKGAGKGAGKAKGAGKGAGKTKGGKANGGKGAKGAS